MNKTKNLKVLDKYILKQLIEVFIMGLIVFTSIIFATDTFLTLIKQIATYGIPFNVAMIIIVLKLPSIIVLTIPMGILLSTLMTLNKMSLNSEITAMRACGVGLSRIAKPVFIFATCASLICFGINEIVSPFANTQAKKLTLWAISQKNVPNGARNFTIKELKDGNQIKRLLYVARCEDNKLHDITVLNITDGGSIQISQVKTGTTQPQYWDFNDIATHTIDPNGKTLNTMISNHTKLFHGTDLKRKINSHKAQEYNFFKLIEYLQKNKNIPEKILKEIKIEMHDKIALPITCIVFALIAIPLAITPPRARFNRGFLFSILIIFIYYLFRALGISLGETGHIPTILAAWIPNIILGSIGSCMYQYKAYKI